MTRDARRLLGDAFDAEEVRAITRQYAFGPALYLACFAVSFASAAVGVAGSVALAIFFAIPPRTALRQAQNATTNVRDHARREKWDE